MVYLMSLRFKILLQKHCPCCNLILMPRINPKTDWTKETDFISVKGLAKHQSFFMQKTYASTGSVPAL